MSPLRLREAGGPVTPRPQVRRAQARVLLAEIDRRGERVTVGLLDRLAVARYAGDLPYTLIREVVVAALELKGLEVPENLRAAERPSQDTYRDRITPPPGALSSDDVHTFIREELERFPGATSTEILDAIEELGTIPMRRSSFVTLVNRTRSRLGISGPAGRPRTVGAGTATEEALG